MLEKLFRTAPLSYPTGSWLEIGTTGGAWAYRKEDDPPSSTKAQLEAT